MPSTGVLVRQLYASRNLPAKSYIPRVGSTRVTILAVVLLALPRVLDIGRSLRLSRFATVAGGRGLAIWHLVMG